MNKHKEKFIFNWILTNKLAVGSSPTDNENLVFLLNKNVKNILCLCSIEESNWHENIKKHFNCERIFLPDSREGKLPTKKDLLYAFAKLKEAVKKDITFVHCFASIERSPLLCIMYIMSSFKLDIEEALDYVRRKHIFTNPTNKQICLVKEIMISKEANIE